MGRASGWLLAFAAASCFKSAVCPADSLAQQALTDTKLYFTAPLRWDAQDWWDFAGTVALIAASHEFDGRVRSHFVSAGGGLNGGKDNNTLRDALPAVALIAGTGIYAAALRDVDGYRETWSLFEAGVFSVTTGEVLSYAAGRERPDATTSPNRWRQGSDSFPSVHASAAFAIGTVFAESGNDEYRWIRRIVGYGIAGATGYIRMRDNEHWLSDTVAGAALGIATARFILDRDSNSTSSLQFQPVKGGWQIAYSVRTR